MKKYIFISLISIIVFTFSSVVRTPTPPSSEENRHESLKLQAIDFSRLIHISDGTQGRGLSHPKYNFTIQTKISPTEVRESTDLTIKLRCTWADVDNGFIKFNITSNSFQIVSDEKTNVASLNGTQEATFLLTPTKTGRRKFIAKGVYYQEESNGVTSPIRLSYKNSETLQHDFTQVSNEHAHSSLAWQKVFEIDVLKDLTVYGLTKKGLELLQIVSAIIGLPSLVMVFWKRRTKTA